MKTKVYFDMDGVLADWVEGYNNLEHVPNLVELNRLEKAEKNIIKETFYTYDFFRNLKPIESGVALINRYLERGDDVCILTATGHINHEEVERAKLDWVKEHINEDIEVLFVKKVIDKKEKTIDGYDKHVLIDDRLKAVEAWEDASDKHEAILFCV